MFAAYVINNKIDISAFDVFGAKVTLIMSCKIITLACVVLINIFQLHECTDSKDLESTNTLPQMLETCNR